MIIVDSGPLISLLNRDEGRLHGLAQLVIQDNPAEVIVPWPVYTEVDLFLRGRGHARFAQALGEAFLRGELNLAQVTYSELQVALDLMRRYEKLGVDLPDATVMAMTATRGAAAFTWDFRHFRAVVLERGSAIPLVVQEFETQPRD
ncbi:MAG TPA: PIN domain-containing protein [Tepidiformaceae bacterium]|nr:PIN domain-containing protein [Tepidiformaceae bacterium]